MSPVIQKPKEQYSMVVIGAGPAGLGAALAAYEDGVRKILLIERAEEGGGILNQCIHNGFGLHCFKEELTGPEYAGRFLDQLEETEIELLTDTMVLQLHPDHRLELSNPTGYYTVQAEAIVLAMGCRERTRGAISLPGSRPAGIFTAGAAQRYLNIEGYQVGSRILILGSGDIGLIMARRLTWEGAQVLACVELMPYSGGLARNIAQCLHDFDIPLYLSHTIVDIQGRERVEGATIAQVDERGQPIPGTEKHFDCDTILLSVGLIPENELSRQAGIDLDSRTKGPRVNQHMETSLSGVYACGNVVHVHDLVDFVTEESRRAGHAAAKRLLQKPVQSAQPLRLISVTTDENLSYSVPQQLVLGDEPESITFSFRVRRVFKNKTRIQICSDGNVLKEVPKIHMAPGEMETVMLPETEWPNIGSTIELRVVEV